MSSPTVHPQRWAVSSLSSFCLRNAVISSKAADRTIFCSVPASRPWCSLHDDGIYGIICLLHQPLKCSLNSLSQRDEETYAELNFPVIGVLSSNTTGEAKGDEGWRTVQRPVSSAFLSNSGFQGPLALPCSRQWVMLAGSQCDQAAVQPEAPTSPWSSLIRLWPPWDCRAKQPVPYHVLWKRVVWTDRCGKCCACCHSLENSKCTFPYQRL